MAREGYTSPAMRRMLSGIAQAVSAHDTVRWPASLPAVPRRSRFLSFLTLCCLLPGIVLGAELTCPQFEFGDAGLLAPVDDGNLILTADEADISQDGFSTLSGTVRLTQGGNLFETQALSFDRQSRIIRVNAESLFRNPSLIVRSREAEFDLVNQTGTFLGTEFTLVERAARGEAGTIRLHRAGTVDVRDVYYTTCAPGSRAWFLEASRIQLDPAEGLGTAKHARLRFGYVPILYAPWFQFPIDDRRRTGFLFPTIGESDNTGLDLRVPFYVNLAPNYDLQLTPRYMSDRGTQLGSEGRYLLPGHTGKASLEYLDSDEKFGDESRSYFDFEHRGLINRRLAVDARYAEVSDKAYFEDLGGRLEAASITHLERSARFSYVSPATYSISARVTDYQTVSSTVATTDTPYRRLPELRVEALSRRDLFDTRLGFEGEFVNFERDDSVPQGQRIDLKPFLRFQQDRSAWYLASQLDLRHTEYLVRNPTPPNPENPNRTLPLFSAEAGLRFDRLTGAGELQTLEPHLFYLYVPYRDQSELPVFDSGEPDFDYIQLFSRNRFSGEDRISDANHLTFAFTSRLLNPHDGMVRLSLTLGQIYRFTQPRVTIDTEPTPSRGVTDFLVGMDYRLSDAWRISNAAQWSPDSNEFERTSLALHYREGRRRGDLSYRYRRDLLLDTSVTPAVVFGSLEQADAALATPVYGNWAVLGRWRYSLTENRSLEALGGLEYQTCCWTLRAGYRRYQFNTQLEYTTGIYLQLELSGLARIGAGFQSLLPPLD
jgi:LPS-assembly protein